MHLPMSISYYNFANIYKHYYRGSRKRHRCRSRDHDPRDVEYDEVQEVLGSKPRDKDPDRKRKRKRSHSRDHERRKDRKERDHYCGDK